MEFTENTSTLEEMLLAQAGEKRIPMNGSIELLPLCNMNCDMCYVRLSREEMEQQGRLRTAEEWLEIGKQMKDAGVLFLLLTGGEPFLYPEFREVYLGLQKTGMILTINTNGTLIDEDWAEFLGKHKPRRVNITLYGADDETYRDLCHYPEGFQKTINGIKLLRRHNIDVKIGGSLTKANQEDVLKLIDIGNDLDIPVRIDTYMLPATRERNKPYNQQSRLDPVRAAQVRIQCLKAEMGEELFPQYIEQTLAKIEELSSKAEISEESCHMSCLAGKCSFTINWQGEMRPCVILSEPAVSVFEVGFDAAWKYITTETDKILLNSKCASCEMRPLCRTCAACALLEAGSYDAVPEYMCQYAEESLRLLRLEKEKIV